MKPFLLYLILIVLAGGACQKKEVEPEGCSFVVKNRDLTYTYRFDTQGRLIHITQNSSSSDVDYSYTYQDSQATIDITYPHSDWLRLHYDVTLSAQGYLLTAQETMYNRLADGTTQERLMSSHNCTYDNQGYLTTHHLDSFIYPVAQPRVTNTYDEQLSYQDGNPVAVSFTRQERGATPISGKITNQYGADLNTLPIPLLFESNPFSFTLDDALKPLLGKPGRMLVTAQTTGTTSTTDFAFIYTFDTAKQLSQAVHASGNTPYAIYMISNGCP